MSNKKATGFDLKRESSFRVSTAKMSRNILGKINIAKFSTKGRFTLDQMSVIMSQTNKVNY